MGFLTSLRNAIMGPPRVRGEKGEAGELAATWNEEYTVGAPEQEGKKIEELSSEPEGPAGAAPFAAGTFLSTESAAIGPEREAQLDEPVETLEAEAEPEEDRGDPDTRS